MKTIYDFTAKSNSGEDVDFRKFKGKVLLIVNTASDCRFTPQYEGLENLYEKYKDAGLVVIGFPCDQFGHQEPGDEAEIAEFCKLNFGVSFPLMKKIEVNGISAAPIYKFLKKRASGMSCGKIKWNFTKFLVSRDGTIINRFGPARRPEDIESSIVKMLEQAD